MSSIRIEKITAQDSLKNCASVLVSAYNSEPWNDEWTDTIALEKLECFYASPKFHGFIAYDGTEILGCCVGNIEPYFTGDYFYLKEMFIDPKAQRKGVGSELMRALRSHLDTLGIKTIILFTSGRTFPFDFYRKEGFEIMEDMCMMHLSTE
jgi:aminoglycoside 6'-N-acetyltransferase I